jgi:hypothetical protein
MVPTEPAGGRATDCDTTRWAMAARVLRRLLVTSFCAALLAAGGPVASLGAKKPTPIAGALDPNSTAGVAAMPAAARKAQVAPVEDPLRAALPPACRLLPSDLQQCAPEDRKITAAADDERPGAGPDDGKADIAPDDGKADAAPDDGKVGAPLPGTTAPAGKVRSRWSAAALATTIILAVMLMGSGGAAAFNWWRLSSQRKAIGAVESALASILGRSKFSVDQTPEVLKRITSQAEYLLGRIDQLEATNKQLANVRDHRKGKDEFRANLFDTTISIVRRVVDVLHDYPSSHSLMAQLNTSLSMEVNLVEAIKALERAAKATEGDSGLVQQLERGELDELLTIGPFLSAYFPSTPELGVVPAALAAVNQLVSFILAGDKVSIRIQRPLSVVEIGTPGTEPFDRRQIRLVASIRERAAREARTLGEGQLLVVDCTSPGWTAPGRATREPRSTIFDPASWT